MKSIFKYSTLLLLASVLAAGCQKEEKIFQRDTDAVSCDGTAQSLTHYIKASGEWSSESTVDWITLDPASGIGDGKSFQKYNINVAYNRGEAREGVFYLIHDGGRFPVIVSQGPSNFKYGAVAFEGTLSQEVESTAYVTVSYSGASGEESVNYVGTVSGEGAAGLSIENGTFDSFESGSGLVRIPVKGTPTAFGEVVFAITLDGKPAGTVATTVAKKEEPPTTEDVTLAVWKFCDHEGTNDDKAELMARHPEWWDTSLRVGNSGICYSDEGKGVLTVQEAAGKTATAINSWGGGQGHLYIKGFYVDDYWLFTMSDVNLKKADEIDFSGSMGGSGSSAGYYICEYSVDGSTWTEAEDALSETVGSNTFRYHVAPKDNITNTVEGAFDVKFHLPSDVNGKLYIRLRVCANVRLNHGTTVEITTGGGGSSRFKGNITVSAKTSGAAAGGVEGLPVGWNFYAAGLTTTADVEASDYNYSWSFGQSGNDNASRHPVGAAQPSYEHKVLATSGNAEAYLTAYGSNVSAYTFNPSIQVKGFGENDYFQMVIPVKNVTPDVKVCVEGAVGAAGSATGNWVLEYSSDAINWFAAPDIKTVTRGEVTFQCHFYNTAGSITTTRKVYDKATDDTYQKYTFPLTGISAIENGNLYFRLRALIWNNNQTAPAANTGGWTDLKGFEVSIAE